MPSLFQPRHRSIFPVAPATATVTEEGALGRTRRKRGVDFGVGAMRCGRAGAGR